VVKGSALKWGTTETQNTLAGAQRLAKSATGSEANAASYAWFSMMQWREDKCAQQCPKGQTLREKTDKKTGKKTKQCECDNGMESKTVSIPHQVLNINTILMF
jgi:hypothetical protein